MKIANIKSSLYPYIPNWIKYNFPYIKKFIELYIFERLSLEKKNKLIERMVLKKVRDAYLNTSFYRAFYDKNNVNPLEFNSIHDLNLLPVLRKSDIAKNTEELILNKFKSRRLIIANTGGSSGNPLKLYRVKAEIAEEYAFLDFYLKKKARKPIFYNVRKVLLRGNSCSNVLIEKKGCNLLISSELMNNQNIGYVISEINSFRPFYLHGYPSSILNLIHIAKGLKLDCDISFILTSSEKIDLNSINIIESFFNSKLIDIYGNSEHSSFAIRGGEQYEFNRYYGFTEAIDGKLISTKLIDSPMPLIRYDCGDTYQLSDMVNNSESLKLKEIGGREIEYLVNCYGDKLPIVSVIYGQHLSFFQFVTDFSLVQNELGSVDIEYISYKSIPKNIETIDKDLIKNKTKGSLLINFKKVDYLRTTKAGKKLFLASTCN
ncbi:hypothetical protein FLL98_17085 [Vibrio cholerae]|uniref:hypothetical protein n=1 Tax=Vibrio cholerae TaxID=666 RepID=UPI00115B6043|nr:hypothetical protein [Vibrio cholerae]TQP50960.1 hypothetical protein FLL98_17085 [Vibrio cholerae]